MRLRFKTENDFGAQIAELHVTYIIHTEILFKH